MFYTTKGYCFIKCNKFLTGEDYKQHYLGFITNEKRRSTIMTMARIQPFRRANNFILGSFDGTRVFSRSVTDRNFALILRNNHFCLLWKSERVSFHQTIRELKHNFKIVNNYITEENVSCHSKKEFILQKYEPHFTNFIVYDLETDNTSRGRPYMLIFYMKAVKLDKIYHHSSTIRMKILIITK